MINGFISFDRFRTEDELKETQKLAQEDNHGLFAPTQLLRKDGKIVGYFSVNHPNTAIVFAWLSTKEIAARESFHLINSIENMVSISGCDICCLPVPKTSPFHPLMESIGYSNMGEFTFFLKKV